MNGRNTIKAVMTRSRIFRGMLLLAALILLIPPVYADKVEGENVPVFEETSLTVVVDKLGTVEIPAVISAQTAYLSVQSLFSWLKIRNNVSGSMDSISGFVTGENDLYLIDVVNNTITYKNEVHVLNTYDLFRTKTHVFINIRYLQEIFGLECMFSLSSLLVKLKATIDLPAFRELRQENIRHSMRQIKGAFEADSTLKREYPLLSLNTADWAVFPQFTSGEKPNLTARATLGGFIAGGETTLGLYHHSAQPFSLNNQYYRWRYVNNDRKLIKQIIAGKIAVQSIATIYSPVIGLQITNSQTGRRTRFGTYRLEETTEPNGIVELYINNVLTDYVKAGATGHFIFDVPLSYGNTEIKLVYYGEWGEETTKVQQITIPYTFVPGNEAEYTLSVGTPDDNTRASFYRAGINYGLSRRMTIGAGNEFLSSIGRSPESAGNKSAGRNIPFVSTSYSPFPGLLLNAEYDYNVRLRSSLTFRTLSSFMFELSYTKYDKNQKAVAFNYREERKLSLTKPFRLGHVSMFSRLAVNQLVINDQLSITLTDFVLSGQYRKVTGSIHSYGTFVTSGNPVLYSDISAGCRLPFSMSLTPSIRYDHTRNTVTGWKIKAEQPVSKNWFITVNYEKYNDYNIRNLQVGIRLTVKGAQAATYLNHHNTQVTINQTINGSLVYDKASGSVMADNVNKVGRGGLTVVAFLDYNSNGKKDQGEPRVQGLDVKVISGGQVVTSEKDTLIRVFNLEPYTQVHLVVSGAGFKNIYWQLPKTSFSIAIDPNSMRLVEIPVIIAEEQ